jgi:2-oxoglutarate ferredoxin oxidoreductase subunit alpha
VGGVFVAGTDEHDEEGWLISDEHTNASLRRVMHEKRMRKMEGVLAQLPPPELHGPPDAEVTLLGWGSTWGAIRDSIARLAEAGVTANHLHLKYLVPFHTREVTAILNACRRTFVVESNFSGQFARHLRAETGFSPDHLILRYDGEPFEPAQIAARVLQLLEKHPEAGEVTEDEAREIAYHYIRIHLADKARPVRFTAAPANGYGEPLWEIELAERQKGQPMGELLIGRTTGATYELRR